MISASSIRVFRVLFLFCLVPLLAFTTQAQNKAWTMTLEEPTGIFRRDAEVVTVRQSFAPGEARTDSLHVVGPDGKPLVAQIIVEKTHPDGSLQTAEILFQANIIPGDRPQYRLISAPGSISTSSSASSIIARRIGVGRVEMANERFGVVLNLGLEGTEPALVAAYNKSAGGMRMLNLIDVSPDVTEPLAFGRRSAGFGTFLARSGNQSSRTGHFDRVEIIESGPLRARVRVSGTRLGERRETWEFTWQANSPVLRWRASLDEPQTGSSYGFFFSSVSATPYLPFDRWMEGVELRFPDGWEVDNPPDHRIGGKDLADLPGRHVVYYQREENYGAFGLFELDPALEWKSVGARQFYNLKTLDSAPATTEIALSFPRWRGTETVIEARTEYRKFIQPMLSVTAPTSETGSVRSSALIPLVNEIPVGEIQRRAGERVAEFTLDGPWRLNSAEKSEGERLGFHRAEFDDRTWREVKVPGTVHTQILEASKIYTREAEWISAREWWYRRSFTVPPSMQNRRLMLRFEATDYYADIYLNGELIGRHEGYIDPYEFDVTARLKRDAPNQLTVRVWTPVSYYWRHRPYTVKGSYGAVDQKPDNITPVGLTRSVRLLAVGGVRISDIAIDTRLNADGSADVIVEAEYDSAEATEGARIELSLAPRNFTSATGLRLTAVENLSAGRSNRRYVLRVARPELWWTWDHGKPNLYTLTAAVRLDAVLSDSYSHAVGIREIEHIDWKFYLNGKRIFIRGTNFYFHLYQSEVRRSDYERDYRMMQAMNINMLRLHCNFSNPEFYDLADELGILVWQDFLEAWYPEDRAFSLKAAALYDPHIKYVRNHASVAIWATSDEESLENYRDLTKHLEPRLYAHDPQRRPVQRSTGRYGDAHVYEGWYGGTIWAYAKMTEKFVSELGATALPNYDSLMKFIPDAWPIREHEDEWVFRKLQLFEAMRAWGEPGEKTLQEYIPQTQDYVARLFQLAIERMRRLKYQPSGGILHFHAVDLWPSVTMAAIDFYRQPTKSYTTVQRSFQMVLPSFAYDRDTWKSGETIKTELWIINDHLFALKNVKVSWRLADAGGRTIQSGAWAGGRLDLEADSSRKLQDLTIPAGAPGRYTLWAQVVDAQGKTIAENNYEFQIQ